MKENEPTQNDRGATVKEKSRCGTRLRRTPGCERWSGETRRPLLCRGIVLAVVAALPLWASCRANTDDGRVEDVAPAPAGPDAGRVTPAAGERHAEHWTCPMHPNVRSHEPGDCPICGMKLVPESAGNDAPGAKPAPSAPAAAGPPTASHIEHHAASPEAGPLPETGPRQVVQTTCPVSGEDINPEVFTDYRSVRVFFCCATCKKKFTNEPAKYVSGLPEAVRQKMRSAP